MTLPLFYCTGGCLVLRAGLVRKSKDKYLVPSENRATIHRSSRS